MATKEISGKIVQLNEEGYMTDPAEWDKDIAAELAKEEGIAQLTDAHWKVIEFCRMEGDKSGKAPTLRQITSGTGLSTKELFTLFPKGPAKKVARVSGLGKPEGCV
jgi:TusE/DsrC/DsvC family sulfur relay protein